MGTEDEHELCFSTNRFSLSWKGGSCTALADVMQPPLRLSPEHIFLQESARGGGGRKGPLRPSARHPPYRAIPIRDSIAERVCTRFALFSYGITQVSLRYLSCAGGIAPQAHARARGIALNLVMLRRSKTNSAQQGDVAEAVSRQSAIWAQ